MFEAIAQDVRYAFRALRGSPGFAAVAILSLALGIGANTAVFSLIDAVMLRSLPVSHPEQLAQVTMGSQMGFSNPLWEQIRDRQDVFSGIFAYGRWGFNLAAGGEARTVHGHYVSGQFFETLGVRAALGRLLTAADDKRGCPATAVLSYGFWQREYGGRRDVIGKNISIDNRPFPIVGVSERGFTGVEVGASADIFAPLCAEKIVHGEISLLDSNFIPGWLKIVGRPNPGVTASQAAARLKTLAPEIYEATRGRRQAHGRDVYVKRTLDIAPAGHGLSYLRGQYREALLVLMTIAGLVLLIACANVANLLLARGASRQCEIAIRMALGCGRPRLIRQLLTESLLLAGAGAILGVLLAEWGARLLAGFLDVYLDLTLDGRVLAFTAGMAVLTGLLFGIAPAWRGARVQPQAAMKARGVAGSSGAGSKFGFGKMTVMAQAALSLPLVVGAGLLLSTFWKLTSVNAGFERDHVLLATVDLRNGNYAPERRLAVLRQILENLRALAGVRSAGASVIPPLCGCKGTVELAIEGAAARAPDDATVLFNRVSARYFETLGAPIAAGRDFNSHDTPASPRVAIINQSLARKYFGAANPIGRHYRYREGNELSGEVEIVGVVEDSKYGSLREEISPTVYAAWNQGGNPQLISDFQLRSAGGDPAALIPGAKSAIASVNGGISMEFATLAAKVNDSLKRERLLAALAGLFGALALLLAAMGLYGVTSYNVARRRNEIGIRMALGAEQARVLRMVLGEVALVIGGGLVAGVAAALATTRFVAGFLYGVTPNDPLTFSAAAAVLAGTALVAGYWPAWRASRLDPMSALREE